MSDPGRRELAWYVLRQFGDLRWPKAGSFYESLVDTCARADPTNLARLAQGFPTLTFMVRLAQNDEGGMALLEALANDDGNLPADVDSMRLWAQQQAILAARESLEQP